MNTVISTIDALSAAISTGSSKGVRRLIAVAGPPASGKSTLAAALVEQLNTDGETAVLVPMDGFHLDNSVLEARGLLPRKGAPETFDADGFLQLVQKLGAQAGRIDFPVFERAQDRSIAEGLVAAAHRTVVVEGNYLLLNRAPWDKLKALWDYSIALDVPRDVLRERLVARWLNYGLSQNAAVARAKGNDLANADVVAHESGAADVVWGGD